MNEKQHEAIGPQALLQAWMKASSEFFDSMTQAGKAPENPQVKASNGSKPRVVETWESTAKAMKAYSALMAEPGAMESLAKGIDSLPEVMIKLIQPAWNGFFHLQLEWMRRAGRIGETTAAYKFENLDQDAFKAFTDLYEKEFRQFLNIPRLGLMRAYQERMSQAADRFNIFQTTMAEFVSLLYLPVEKSVKVVQEKIASLADEGKLPETSKDVYNLWLKVLEGHYMTLFKSPEYTSTLGKTIDALSEFITARQQILQDILQFFPIPTQTDMDELYKEIYLLKKRVKQLEKQDKMNKLRTDTPN
ncbi:MAG TPA: poly(R)-hydroxyalkanoic acid synthase subunit PhaE [Desulfomonilaceae bacterium]|nr:poly(R)-hydroxyalkanoic acid synthase subunit PhaE [Desulfomonilaceae bacterium]